MWLYVCLRIVVEVELSNERFLSMLSTPYSAYNFLPSWVSTQLVVQGARAPPTFKRFESMSLLVYSTCHVGILVRHAMKCTLFKRPRFGMWWFF